MVYKQKWIAFVFIALICLPAILMACTYDGIDVTDQENTPHIFLRDKPKNGEYVFPEALFIGKLTIIDSCVMLVQDSENAAPLTPSWPDYAQLMKADKSYYIQLKNKRLEFGKTYNFGGGFYDVAPDTPMHEICGATSMWFVGNVE